MSGPGRPGPDPLPREHGTTRGHWQHYSRGEEVCLPCRVVAAEDASSRYAARKAEWARARTVVALQQGGAG